MTIPLSRISRCFGGIVPGAIATCSADGTPNVSYLSHVQIVDDRHLAVSCQFFNKTRRNLDESPRASIQLHDPVTFRAYRIGIRFLRAETEGPLFDEMAARIEVIASHVGMKGIFRLLSADVFEVLTVEEVEGFLEPVEAGRGEPLVFDGVHPGGPMLELHRLQMISDRINRACDLESLLASTLAALEELFGFTHAMVLVPEAASEKLVAIASRGYGDGCIGAELAIGDGLFGTSAKERRVLAAASIDADLRYGRAVRDRTRQTGARVTPEIPLPGLTDARSQLAIPLLVEDRLLGVLAIESRDPAAYEQWHTCFLQVIGNQIASRIDHLTSIEDDDAELERGDDHLRISMPTGASRTHTVCFYKNDDCVFVDGEYLIRNVPGKILWKLLTVHARERRMEYTNRELRLDPWLGLPAVKDNLESRLILLRKRLEQKCPDIRLVPTRRGRFALELDCAVELIERESA